jgi:hypothetical protein
VKTESTYSILKKNIILRLKHIDMEKDLHDIVLHKYLNSIKKEKAELNLRQEVILKEKTDLLISILTTLKEETKQFSFDVIGNAYIPKEMPCLYINEKKSINCIVDRVRIYTTIHSIGLDVVDVETGYKFEDILLEDCQSSIIDNLLDYLTENFTIVCKYYKAL